MKASRWPTALLAIGLVVSAVVLDAAIARASDPLPSWKDGKAKQSIIAFVKKVTSTGSPDYVPPAERIATFDNDGTLWAEQPMYVQLAFALDRVRELAAAHPEWKQKQPFKAALEGDFKAVAAGGEHALLELIMATHAGMTTDEFAGTVSTWLASAKHPRFKRLYTGLVYQPMLELLAYLRANGFKTFIASGGGIELMRVFAGQVYGIPPEQVIGSSIKMAYEVRDGRPVLKRLPEIDFINDKAGKPVGIWRQIGRRPIAAFGNSDGDFEMLEWVTRGRGPHFGLLVHHDDAQREWAYDRKSPIGNLQRGLDQAPKRGWTVVSMQKDWITIFKP